MRADFAAFFEDVNIFGGKRGSFIRGGVFFEKIGEMQGAGQAGGACAHDQYICFELFAFDGHGPKCAALRL